MLKLRWPLRPKLRQDQLLYDWILDLADAYDVYFDDFCENVLALEVEELYDLKTVLPERVLMILSEGADVPIDELRKRNTNKCGQFWHFNFIIKVREKGVEFFKRRWSCKNLMKCDDFPRSESLLMSKMPEHKRLFWNQRLWDQRVIGTLWNAE